MASIPNISDPTLTEMENAMVAEAAKEPPRPYLGMSSIGEPCARKLWYRLRWFASEQFDAATLARFADGHYSEDCFAARLRLVEAITLITHTESGQQIGYSDIGGHFRGHMDGEITGLLQAPKTPHVWEHKCVNQAKFNKLQRLIESEGEKSALSKWDEVYYAQAVLYMHYGKYKRHYLTVNTAGSRDWTSCRTEENPAYAKELIAKAEQIINANQPPPKISNDPAFYQCGWCPFREICHGGNNAPAKNCRTCSFSEPEEAGQWKCTLFGDVVPLDFQRIGCDQWKRVA